MPSRITVAAALYEQGFRHHGVAQQVIQRESQGIAAQSMDQKLMLVRIDRGYAIVVTLKMQAAGCNGALQPVQGSP